MNNSADEICAAIVAHREKPLLLLKIDPIRAACLFEIRAALKGKQFDDLDVLIQTPGGDADAAYVITKLLKNHAKKISILVPLFAKSAGTLICLGADEIILTEISELGPLDSQIPEHQDGGPQKYTSALNGLKALEQVQLHTIQTLDIAIKMIHSRSGMKMNEVVHLAAEFCGQTSGTLYSQLDPKKIGEYARALDIGRRYGETILTRLMKWNATDAKNTVRKLVDNYPSHDYVIDIEELRSLGLPSKLADDLLTESLEKMRDFLLDFDKNLIKLFEEPVKQKNEHENKK